MPKWLLEALRNYTFTEQEKVEIIESVLKSSREWHEINDRFKITQQDKNKFYNT